MITRSLTIGNERPRAATRGLKGESPWCGASTMTTVTGDAQQSHRPIREIVFVAVGHWFLLRAMPHVGASPCGRSHHDPVQSNSGKGKVGKFSRSLFFPTTLRKRQEDARQ